MIRAAAVTAIAGCSVASGAAASVIRAISVCRTGSFASLSCHTSGSDTEQPVLAQETTASINTQVPAATDEHSSVFAPMTLGGNSDYVFFVAGNIAKTVARSEVSIGAVALSSAGPGANGQWSMGFASGYDQYGGVQGPVFDEPTGETNCPQIPDGTFDDDYAAPGSVVPNPAAPPGNVLMVYEGVNTCLGAPGGPRPGRTGTQDSYSSIGVATSTDYGMEWPSYGPNSNFAFVPLPKVNPTQGPQQGLGAFGTNANLCIGANVLTCSEPKPYDGYGRYAVMSAPFTLADAAAWVAGHNNEALNELMGDAQPSAFVDDVKSASAPYVYVVQDYAPGGGPNPKGGKLAGGLDPLPKHREHDLAIGRALLNDGSGSLLFQKWDGSKSGWLPPASGQTENSGDEAPILPAGGSGTFQYCEDVDPPAPGIAPQQARSSGSISYVTSTQQYLLLFVCTSKGDPRLGATQSKPSAGAAWFYSTSASLANQKWSTPTEVVGTWNAFPQSGGKVVGSYNGWYPVLMSTGVGQQPGQLTNSGYAFYLWGCENGATGCPMRHYTSRQFTILTSSDRLPKPAVTRITGPSNAMTLRSAPVQMSFRLRSRASYATFRCSFAGTGLLVPCPARVTGSFTVGPHELRARALNALGLAGPITTFRFTVSPQTQCFGRCM